MLEPLVLASSSPWRADLLRAVGLDVVVDPPLQDERSVRDLPPVELAVARATLKAADVAPRHPGRWVIGADQVVFLGRRVFEKPGGDLDHLQMLQALRGRRHELVTAVCLARTAARGGQPTTEVFEVRSGVTLRADLGDDELRAYVASGDARGCAGGYRVEQRGAWLVESVDGDWTNVVGLPMFALLGRLRERGWWGMETASQERA